MENHELKPVRLTLPEQFRLIEPKFFEQVKDFDYKINRIYEFGPAMLANPLTFFYILIRPDAKIKGILWMSVNCFAEKMQIHVLSIDKEYQHQKQMESLMSFLGGLPKQLGLSPVISMETNRPEAFERFGWKKSQWTELTLNTEDLNNVETITDVRGSESEDTAIIDSDPEPGKAP